MSLRHGSNKDYRVICNNKKNKDAEEYNTFKIENTLLQFYLSILLCTIYVECDFITFFELHY